MSDGIDTTRATQAGAAVTAESASARWLRISVLRNGRPVVQVSFPAYAVLNLPDLVPDEVRPHLLAQAIDLEGLGAMTAARGCPPGEIFAVPGGGNVVRAWLE